MNDLWAFFDSLHITTALKWAITILVTGFIAQFGRKFAEYLIERSKKRRKNTGQDIGTPGSSAAQPGTGTPSGKSGKLEKKLIKSQQKKEKKYNS